MFWFDYNYDLQNLLNQQWWLINFLLLATLVVIGFLAHKKTVLAAGLTIILLPTYLIRTKIGPIPVTFLELAILVTFFGWLTQKLLTKNWLSSLWQKKNFPLIFWPAILLLISTTVAVFIGPNLIAGAGLWKAYFLEPLLFFIVLKDLNKNPDNKKIIFISLALSALPVAALAIYQWFTGFGIAQAGWLPKDVRRVNSFFTSPNAVGLYLGPIVLITTGWLLGQLKIILNNQKKSLKDLQGIAPMALIILLSLLAILFTKSWGTFFGLFAGILFLAFFILGKKITAVLIAFFLLAIIMIPALSNRLKTEVTFADASGQNRLLLWQLAQNNLIDNPKNFILGLGIGGFAPIQDSWRDPLKMEALLYPHNIILNFWTEIGLTGLIALVWVMVLVFWQSKKKNNSSTKDGSYYLRLGALAALLGLIAHGLIDVPYFKNDLAIIFWLIISLI